MSEWERGLEMVACLRCVAGGQCPALPLVRLRGCVASLECWLPPHLVCVLACS